MRRRTLPKFLEKKLKAEYGKNSKIPFKVMNSMGVMHGNKVTSNGRAMEAKHSRGVKLKSMMRGR